LAWRNLRANLAASAGGFESAEIFIRRFRRFPQIKAKPDERSYGLCIRIRVKFWIWISSLQSV